MREFLATDRCDGCGAQAHHEATKVGFSELLFCNHHHHEHKDALLNTYWLIESRVIVSSAQPVSAYTE